MIYILSNSTGNCFNCFSSFPQIASFPSPQCRPFWVSTGSSLFSPSRSHHLISCPFIFLCSRWPQPVVIPECAWWSWENICGQTVDCVCVCHRQVAADTPRCICGKVQTGRPLPVSATDHRKRLLHPHNNRPFLSATTRPAGWRTGAHLIRLGAN